MVPEFTMPHWSDPAVVAVAGAIYDDAWRGSTLTFQRGDAVQYWPGIEARKFVTMMRAYEKATTASAVGMEAPLGRNAPENRSGEGGAT